MQTSHSTVIALPSVVEGADTPRDRAGVRPAAHLELTRRGRSVLIAVAFLLGLLVAVAALLVFDVPSALAGGEGAGERTVVVAEGDTLWSVAEQHAPAGVSPQEYIAEVRTLNEIPTGRLDEGRALVLPADSAVR